jgi:mRNA interferase RelE/StbE
MSLSAIACKCFILRYPAFDGRENVYRIRIGNYRIVYEVHVTKVIVYSVGVAHRREVYRRILNRR